MRSFVYLAILSCCFASTALAQNSEKRRGDDRPRDTYSPLPTPLEKLDVLPSGTTFVHQFQYSAVKALDSKLNPAHTGPVKLLDMVTV